MAEADKKDAIRDIIRDFIKALIDDYKYGYKSADEVCSAWDEYRSTHKLFYMRDEDLRRVCENILPETCAAYRAAGSEAQDPDRMLNFWKGLKDCDFLLYFGRTFTEEREEYLSCGRERRDPVEYTDRFLRVEPEVERLVRLETGEGGWTGFCHTYWAVKKRILREQFGIDWQSTDDRFPGLLID
ncbi:MAG: hypothetical protein IJH90_00945 [Mogibacterium sp.]|nr:hypothetical protein [Mogibacterium sp.]